MAIKKSELCSTLWKSCDELRGGMDASQYKDYVLVILFVKYVSDKAKADPDFIIEVPDGCYFDDFVALKGKSNIGEEFNKKMAALANNNDLDGVINVADFCDENKLGKGKDMIETLSNLIGIFQSSRLDFGKNRASDDDLMGDAYEYLMKNFASQSGKSKGEFYTPAEVSRVMAQVLGLHSADSIKTTIYDPTCGSGSLLLRAMSETPHGATLYGQEKDIATAGLAKMNMILHGVVAADIRCQQHRDRFYQLSIGIKPKLLIGELGNSLLHIFIHDKSLVDAYDVYDQLMNYWSETMQDDFYLIASDGWKAEPYVPQPAAKKDKDGNEKKVNVWTVRCNEWFKV